MRPKVRAPMTEMEVAEALAKAHRIKTGQSGYVYSRLVVDLLHAYQDLSARYAAEVGQAVDRRAAEAPPAMDTGKPLWVGTALDGAVLPPPTGNTPTTRPMFYPVEEERRAPPRKNTTAKGGLTMTQVAGCIFLMLVLMVAL